MNGIVSVEVEGKKIDLHFGMVSTQIFAEKVDAEMARLAERGSDKISDIKFLAIIIYSGICNKADINETQYPDFADCYLLAENIASEQYVEQQKVIWNAWTTARPTQGLLERLGIKLDTENEAKEDKKKVQRSGKK